MRRFIKLSILCLSVAIVFSCSDSGTNVNGDDGSNGDNDSGSSTGTVEVTTTTSGDNQDSDGYTITLGDSEQDISANGTVTFEDLEEDNYDAELSNIAENCGVDGDNPRSVEVNAGETTSTTFNVSCSANVEDDKENIQSSMDDAIASLDDLRNGMFVGSLENFLGSSAEWKADISSGFENIFMLESSQNRFDYASKTGVYVWDSSSESFSNSSSSENIVVEFPAAESSTSNNAEFTFSEYSDASTTVDGEQVYLPTRVQSELMVDGESTFALNLNDAEYTQGNLPIPSLVDLEILTAPSTHTLSFERNNDTNFSFSYDLSNEEQSAFGLSLSLELANSDYSTLQEEDLETLEGSVSFSGNLTVDLTVDDFGELIQLQNPSENTVNSLVAAEVYYNDEKVGELEYSAEEENVIIIYRDGSSETVDRYIEGFQELFQTASNVKTSVQNWVNIEN